MTEFKAGDRVINICKYEEGTIKEICKCGKKAYVRYKGVTASRSRLTDLKLAKEIKNEK